MLAKQTKQLMVLSGIPASGKSTFARELLKKEPGRWKRVNRDSLRAMLDDGQWSRANEKLVTKFRDYGIRSSLRQGFSVIVDDTNLSSRVYKDLCKIAEEVGDVTVVHKFFDISMKDAIKRDAAREHSVTPPVIGNFYKKYVKGGRFIKYNPVYYPPLDQAVPQVKYNPNLPDCIICDIDGTLAHIVDRSPYDGESCASDVVDAAVLAVLSRFTDDVTGYRHPRIILMSGRNGESKPQTIEWLAKNAVPYDELYMRTAGDSRKDCVIKGELFDKFVDGQYNVLFCLDDRNQMVDYYRSRGLKVFQVAEGNF